MRRPALRELARLAGIADDYRPMRGAAAHRTSDATRERLLAAMGHEASSESAARRALADWRARREGRLLDPVRVLGEGRVVTLPVRTGLAPGTPFDWQIEARQRDGDGTVRRGRGRARAGRAGHARLPLPRLASSGDFLLDLSLDAEGAVREGRGRLALAPARCLEPAEVLGARQARGLVANLYALRSSRDQGVGDLGALATLAGRMGRLGFDFLGLSPLHATRGRGSQISPYSPSSRLFRSEVYLDIEAIPEIRDCAEARRVLARPATRQRLERWRQSDSVDWDGVSGLKRDLLLRLHREFARRHRGRRSARGRAYTRFLAREGELLEHFATFLALVDRQTRAGQVADWRRWPAALRRADSGAVARFRHEAPEAIDFHRWVQFELDRQLAGAAQRGARVGMRVGLYADLAVGCDPGGFDTWVAPDLYATRARVGAPPDDFSAEGQDWGLPPMIPEALLDRGLEDWTRLLRANMRHAGMLRLDHAMGLERLWWIPAGRPPGEGAYVAYPTRELMALLALESRRQQTLVVGEDLGTVPRGFGSRLARRGVLSMRVMLFERQGRGFRRPEAVSRRALVVSTTHDLAPLAGWLEGRDLHLREAAGALPDAAAARSARTGEAAALRRRLGLGPGLGLGLGPELGPTRSPGALARAAWRWLRATPAPLVAMPLDDAVEATEPVNLPGVPQERHPSWTRRLGTPVEALGAQLARLVDVRRARAGRGTGGNSSSGR